MTRKQIILARIILGLYLVAVAVLCLANFSSAPSVKMSIFGIPTDKVVHFCMFFPLPFLAFFAFDEYTDKAWSSILFTLLTFAVGVGIAALTEWAQSLTPYRSAEHGDFIADIISLGTASLIVVIIDIAKQHKNEKTPA